MTCATCGYPVDTGPVCQQCGTPAPIPGMQAPPAATTAYGTPAPAQPASGPYGVAAPAPDAYGYGMPPTAYGFAAPPIRTPGGMNLPRAVAEVLSKYATFQGRATRSEFWWWTLAWWLVLLVPWLIGAVGSSATGAGLYEGPITGLVGIYTVILLCATIVPWIAVTVRRLHDIGLTGWLYLINFVPSFGSIALLVICALPSKPVGNQYGLAPEGQRSPYQL